MSHSRLDSLSRAQLAEIGREYMLIAQMNSRTGYAALAMNHGQEAYKETAIDNWMAASPVYSKRMQEAMRLDAGSDVAKILKGMQLECGLSHQYFDARFELNSEEEGFFWLNSCGPLLETEPRGDDAVRVMCHDIEDPTFDATAAAGNPRARVRPVHRPPRLSTDQSPVCRWRVYIDHEAQPLTTPEVALAVFETQLARVELRRGESSEPGGLDYYDGPLFERLDLERFSQSALAIICKELAIQIHLLIHGLGQAVACRFGQAAAVNIAFSQMIGTCWVASERLANVLGYGEKGGIDAIIDVINIHPAFQPGEYISLHVSQTSGTTAVLELRDCPAAHDQEVFGWFKLLSSGQTDGLAALIHGVDPRATVEIIDTAQDANVLTVKISVDSNSIPAELPRSVQIAKSTQLYETKLENRIDLIDVVSI